MLALSIIADRANPEGWPIQKAELAELLCKRVLDGKDIALCLNGVVMTVGREEPVIHIYSAGCRTLLSTIRQLTKLAWTRTDFNYLLAPITNPTLKKIALRQGWKPVERILKIYTVFKLERP